MRRNLLFLLMLFTLTTACLAQFAESDSEKVLNEFLRLGEQRNLNKAMSLVANQEKNYKDYAETAGLEDINSKEQISEKYSQITMNLWNISKDKIKILKITGNKISNNLEIFRLKGIDQTREFREAEAVLIKVEGDWKVFSFTWDNKINTPSFTFQKLSKE